MKCLKRRALHIPAGILFFLPAAAVLILTGCGRGEMNSERAVESIAGRMDLNEEQAQKLSPIVEELFAQRETLNEVRKSVFDEVLAQLKEETADAKRLETVLANSLQRVREKLPIVSDSFAQFHAMLTPVQRREIVEHMEKRKGWKGKHRWHGHWRHRH